MFESEWALFAAVAFYACDVGTDRELGLLRFKAAMSVVTIAALHRSFENLVMKRFGELRFLFIVATETKLGLAGLEQLVISLLLDQCHRSVFGNCPL